MTDRDGNARTAVIGFMGARGAGITSLLGFIGGMAARAGAGRADARYPDDSRLRQLGRKGRARRRRELHSRASEQHSRAHLSRRTEDDE